MVVRLRMRKNARGRVFLVIEPYSKDTRDIRRDRPVAISMYLDRHGLVLHYVARIIFKKMDILPVLCLKNFLNSASS